MTVQSRFSIDEVAGFGLRAWVPVLGSVASAAAVFAFLFWHEITAAVRVWSESTAYNHCFLVLPMAAVLVWLRRQVFASLRPSPAPWALLLVTALSLTWFFVALLDVLEAEQLVIVALFEALLLAMAGPRVFRALLAPLLFLFFLVPFGAFLVPTLQSITVAFAVGGLKVAGIPTFADGISIDIPEGHFEVVEACAGLRFLIASIVFGCFFATIMYRSRVRRAAFISLSVVLPIVANGFRAFGLILLAHLEGSAASALADHVLYGWVFFSLVTLVLIGIGMTFAEQAGPAPVTTLRDTRRSSQRYMTLGITALGLIIIAIAPAYVMRVDRSGTSAANYTLPGPPLGSIWAPVQDATDWDPAVIGASYQSTHTFIKDKARVTEFVAVYPLPARRTLLTRSENSLTDADNWRTESVGKTDALLGDGRVVVNSTHIARGARHRLIWWFYLVDGKATDRKLSAKLLQARAALTPGEHVGMLVAISTESTDGARPDETALNSFLSSL